MKKKKVKALYKFKTSDDPNKCFAIAMIEFRRERLLDKYAFYKELLNRKKPHSNQWNKTLGKVRKLHNQIRALFELLDEIQRLHGRLKNATLDNFYEVFPITRNGKSDFARSCKGKIAYNKPSSEDAAVKVSKEIGETLESYKCRHCEHWHIGHAVI